MSATARPHKPGLFSRLAQLDDGVIVRTAFFVMLAGALAMLYIDWQSLAANDLSAFVAPQVPVLPAYDPDSPATPPGPQVTTDSALLTAPLVVSLGHGGVLNLTGTVDPGAADRVAAALESQGEYVTTVALDSPGGSVDGAIAIGKAIRDHGFVTTVAAGSICASSCPLMLAGGVERKVSRAAAVGVHQIYAALQPKDLSVPLAAGQVISDTQKSTAEITRYLTTSGIDPALWLHALDTPPNRLYYLAPAELTSFKLATTISD